LDDQPLSYRIDNPRDRSLADDLRLLAEDSRAYAEAELAFQKQRAAVAGQGIKAIAIFGALAAALVFFALMALTVGLVLALTPLLGAWGAAGASFAGLLLLAAICALLASARFKRMKRFLAPEDKEA
jgi:uncharacterized membrane protein YqjE